MRRLLLALLAVVALAPGIARAVEPDEVLQDPALEARARDISTQLRCLVCQNQSIDDSHAALAKDLRLLVRDRLKAGDTDAQVQDYLVARYGDFVLLKPPVKTETLLLWGLPFLILGGGALGLVVARRGAVAPPPPVPLDAREESDLAALLGPDRG